MVYERLPVLLKNAYINQAKVLTHQQGMAYNLVEYITVHPQAPGSVHAKASAEGAPH